MLALPAIAETNVEDRLITVLQSSATQVEKEDACRWLKQVGTPRSVPALAQLLGDERLFQAAGDALETMPFKEVDAALRAALQTSTGKSKVGLIHALGERRDLVAVQPLRALLSDSNSLVASSAARALGTIGGKEASRALVKAMKSTREPVRAALVDAVLHCAMQGLAEGELAKASALLKPLVKPTEKEQVRVAAFAGLLRVADDRELSGIIAAIKGSDTARQTAALQVAREVRDSNAIRAFTNLLVQVSPAMQIAVLGLLQQRGDMAATPAVMAMARSPESAVRLVALAALGTIGDATAIPVLAEAAAARDEAEQKIVRSALIEIRFGNITEAMVGYLAPASPAVQAELIRALAARHEKSAVPKLLELARTETGPVRRAALRGLEQLADGADLPALVQLLVAASDDATSAGIRSVFESLADRAADGRKLDVTPIVEGLSKGDASALTALIQVCSYFPDPRIRSALRAALKDTDAAIQSAAVRALCETRDTELLADLLELARNAKEFSSLAFDRYVRIVGDEANGIIGLRRVQLLRPAYDLAKTKEQKWSVLAALAGASHLEALDLANRARANGATRAEAEIACAKIAKSLLTSEPTAATTALRQLATSSSPGTRTNARVILKQFDSGWVYAGPYRMKGRECRELFDTEFPPEQRGTNQIEWRRAAGTPDLSRPGEVDLAEVVGGDHCAVYLKTRVFAPKAQPVTLEIGSDDGIKLWVNGDLAHANNAVRGLTPAQDRAKASLRDGWNDLFAKITQSTDGCGMMLRIVGEAGAEIPGMSFDPRGGYFDRDKSGFTKLQLSDKFYAEGASYGDFNRDGILDVVAGPFWFAGPDFKARHEFRPPKTYDPLGYSDSFLYFTHDFNGDGWLDIFCVPFPGAEGFWFENPQGKDGPWPRHLAYPMVGNESPAWCDLTGDGRPELVFNNEGFLGYATFDPAKPNDVWTFHAISPKDGRFQRFTHGMGVGDLNGDGRKDVIEAAGWWEQPADLNAAWKFHPQRFAEAASQMLVTDVDGDGLPDIINAWHCHRYGFVWHRQLRTAGGEISWSQNVIMSPTPDLRLDEVRFSELHAMDLVDMNGDGQPDVVTGKRFWAHGPVGDVEPDAPAVLCWYEFQRTGNGQASFIPHFIDDDSGVGTQVIAVDLNGDQRPDVIVANKKGIFVHLSEER